MTLDQAGLPAAGDQKPTCRQCSERPAQICDECRRACALKWFSGISRHPESMEQDDVACLVCEDGPASWCGLCWAQAVAEYRTTLREQTGRHIGRWPNYSDSRYSEELLLQGRRDAEEIARLKAELGR